MSEKALSTDLVSRLRTKASKGGVIPIGDMTILEAADEIERLREVVTIPLLTPETTNPGLFLRVLREHEKGQAVNGQDLINALMWRVNNQRQEIARLNSRVSAARKAMRGTYE